MATRKLLRASDADRDTVVERLRAAASEGRLDTDELDERVHVALRARTYGELDALVGDLPSGARPRRRTGGAAAGARAVLAATLPLLVGLAVVAAVVTAAALAAAWWILWVVLGFALCGRGGCSPRRLAAGPPRRRAVPARRAG